VSGETILLICTPGVDFTASAIESSQNFAVRAGVSKVRKLSLVAPASVGALVEHAARARVAATVTTAASLARRGNFTLFSKRGRARRAWATTNPPNHATTLSHWCLGDCKPAHI